MARTWIRRRGGAKRFHYETEAGAAVRDARTLGRIAALVVPPAWTDVHIAASPSASVQAWGFDARGRRQYRYHDRAVAQGALRKYYRVREMARDLPGIRRRVHGDFTGRGASPERIAAGVVKLIASGCLRIGSERYTRENRTFGITTLRKTHASVDGDCVIFSYRGKRAVKQRQVVVGRELALFVKQLATSPGTRLFRYKEESGKWRDLTSDDVNTYLRDIVGVPYTAKDFRTWGGTLRVATVLAELGPARTPTEAKRNVMTAVRLAAAELGNTPTICRESYVHPIIIAKYLDEGLTIAPALEHARRTGGLYAHAPEERALIAFLDEHFPERRSTRRKAGEEEAESARKSAEKGRGRR